MSRGFPKKFCLIATTVCFTIASRLLAATCSPNPIGSAAGWNAFISGYNTTFCSPANINGTLILLSNFPAFTTPGTLTIAANSAPDGISGTTPTIVLIHTATSGVNISLGSGLLLEQGSVNIANGSLIFNDPSNWNGTSTGINTLNLQGGATLEFVASGSGTLAFGSHGAGTGSLVLTGTNTIQIDPTNIVEFSGVIAGSGSFVKTGSGTMIVSGSNTYTNGTVLNNGCLNLSNSTGLGAGSLIINTGTTFILGNGITVNNSLLISGSANIGISSGSATLSGQISGAGDL